LQTTSNEPKDSLWLFGLFKCKPLAARSDFVILRKISVICWIFRPVIVSTIKPGSAKYEKTKARQVSGPLVTDVALPDRLTYRKGMIV
jgi:hypothetical protein